MRNAFVVIFFLFVLNNIQAHRENTYYLSGSFDENEVGIRIDEYGETCVLRYFKIGETEERTLRGNISKENEFIFEFTEQLDTQKYEGGLKPGLVLQEVTTDVWVGVFVDDKGIDSQVKLSPIILDSLKHPFIEAIVAHKINPYTALRTMNVSFEKQKIKRFKGGGKVVEVKDNIVGVNLFRIKFKRNKVNADSINNVLIAAHLRYVEAAMSCDLKGVEPIFKVDYNVLSLSQSTISYSINIASNCLGGSLRSKSRLWNKWIGSGKDVLLEDVLWFGDTPWAKMRVGSQEWYKYRYTVFPKYLYEKMLTIYPERFKEGACDYNNLKGWQFPKWHFLKEGIYVGYYHSMYNSQCNQPAWTILPWESVEDNLIKKIYTK